MLDLNIIKILIPTLAAFLFGIFSTPIVLAYLHKYKAWRRHHNPKEVILEDEDGTVDAVINKTEKDKIIPRMGGFVIIIAVALTIILFWSISFGIFGNPSGKIDFLSRSQTWLVAASFFAGSFMGFFDDLFTIRNTKFGRKVGLPLKYRIIFVAGFATFAAWWFETKLGYSSVLIPFYGDYILGAWFIPFFVTAFVAVFATSNIDGLDGLAGGIMAIVYGALGFIALFQDKIDIAAFSFAVVGAILAFLWFNISPARFYMTEVGYNALSFGVVIIAFLTDTILLLPIIAIMLFLTLLSTILQVFSIKVFKKRIFKVAPLHHHLEASGWSETQIVMRYWIVSIVSAILGVAVAVVTI